MKLTKTEQAIIDSINADGYCAVVHGYSSSARGRSFGNRMKKGMQKLLKKGLVSVSDKQEFTRPVFERFGGSITGTEFTTETVLRIVK